MSILVKYDDLDTTFYHMQSVMTEWADELSSIREKLGAFVNMDSFQGKSADSIKSYISEVHFTILESLYAIISEYMQQFLLYKSGYQQGIDSDLHAILDVDLIENLHGFYRNSYPEFSGVHMELETALQAVSDLLNFGAPSPSALAGDYDQVLRDLDKLGNEIADYESAHRDADFANLKDMISATGKLISSREGKNVLSYVPGSVRKSLAYSELANTVLDVYNKWESQQDFLTAAYEGENGHIEALMQETEAEALKQDGIWQTITGGLILIGATVLIVATAGAATPIAGAGIIYAVGAMSAVYGAAEFVEGNNKYQLGEEGNLTDKAWNPVRDTVFAGNQTLYDQYGTISTIAVMIVAPYAAGARAAAGVVGQAAARSVLINEAGRVVFSYATGAVGGYVGNVAGTHFYGANVGRYWGLVGGIVGGAVGYKIAPKVFNALDNIGVPKVPVEGNSRPSERPSWRQSELDSAKDFADFKPQQSFKKMPDGSVQEVPYGTKGSTRPDYYKPGYSVDIKNYDITTSTSRNNLTNNISKQYQQRIESLPLGTKQTVIIDIRGQDVSSAVLDNLYNTIVQRTNAGIEISFKITN